jgi:hypothetical protein
MLPLTSATQRIRAPAVPWMTDTPFVVEWFPIWTGVSKCNAKARLGGIWAAYLRSHDWRMEGREYEMMRRMARWLAQSVSDGEDTREEREEAREVDTR